MDKMNNRERIILRAQLDFIKKKNGFKINERCNPEGVYIWAIPSDLSSCLVCLDIFLELPVSVASQKKDESAALGSWGSFRVGVHL